jgi:superfamily II DNA helicase RecQ
MAHIKPRNREDLLQITGIGEHKADKYGTAFLAEIDRFL